MKRTRVRPVSAKREAEREARRALRWQVEARDGPYCRAENVVPHIACGGPLDMHEVIPRSAWPGGHLIAENVCLVCRVHHGWIGDRPDEAHALGLHGYAYERPEDN